MFQIYHNFTWLPISVSISNVLKFILRHTRKLSRDSNRLPQGSARARYSRNISNKAFGIRPIFFFASAPGHGSRAPAPWFTNNYKWVEVRRRALWTLFLRGDVYTVVCTRVQRPTSRPRGESAAGSFKLNTRLHYHQTLFKSVIANQYCLHIALPFQG